MANTYKPFILYVGDTLRPLGIIFKSTRGAIALNSGTYTVKFAMDDSADADIISWTSSRITIEPTKAVTANATTHEFTAENHQLLQDDEIIFATDDTLPAPLVAGTRYFVRNASPHKFKVSDRPNGTPIELTNAGTGNHTFYIVGYAHYTFDVGDSATPTTGTAYNKAYFQLIDSGGKITTYPLDDYIPVKINAEVED
jgi:hypothetical protein